LLKNDAVNEPFQNTGLFKKNMVKFSDLPISPNISANSVAGLVYA
jgi:hypothetical protein